MPNLWGYFLTNLESWRWMNIHCMHNSEFLDLVSETDFTLVSRIFFFHYRFLLLYHIYYYYYRKTEVLTQVGPTGIHCDSCSFTRGWQEIKHKFGIGKKFSSWQLFLQKRDIYWRTRNAIVFLLHYQPWDRHWPSNFLFCHFFSLHHFRLYVLCKLMLFLYLIKEHRGLCRPQIKIIEFIFKIHCFFKGCLTKDCLFHSKKFWLKSNFMYMFM